MASGRSIGHSHPREDDLYEGADPAGDVRIRPSSHQSDSQASQPTVGAPSTEVSIELAPSTGRSDTKPQRRMSAEDRRDQLRRVAMEVFAERGYRGTSMAEVASRAGVTKPVIYRHFRSKKDLYLELLDDAAENLLSRLWQGVEEAGEPFEAAKRGFLTYFDFVNRHAEAFRLLQSEAVEEPEILKKLEDLKEKVIDRICSFFEQAGVMDHRDRRIAATCLVGMTELAAGRLVLSGDYEPERVAELAASLLVGGVGDLLARFGGHKRDPAKQER
jgi:AcrR family transcriptional regulator